MNIKEITANQHCATISFSKLKFMYQEKIHFLSRNCFKYFYSSFYLFTLPMGTLFIIWVKGNHIYHLNMNACCVPYSWQTVYIPTPRPTSCIMSKNYLAKSLHSSSGIFQHVKNVFKRMTLNYVQFLLRFYKYLTDKDIQNMKKSYKKPLMNLLNSITFVRIVLYFLYINIETQIIWK